MNFEKKIIIIFKELDLSVNLTCQFIFISPKRKKEAIFLILNNTIFFLLWIKFDYRNWHRYC